MRIGIRSEEAEGQSFLNLDIGLPVDQLKGVIRSCLNGQSGSEELALHATNRKGKLIECRVACSPLAGSRNESECEGVILVMEEREG